MKLLLAPFKWLWKLANSDKAQKALRAVDGMIEAALPIVKQIAALTPTRADDELIRLFEMYGQRYIDRWLGLPVDQRGKVLLMVAEAELGKMFPGVPLNQISAAVSFAVTLMKNEGVGQ